MDMNRDSASPVWFSASWEKRYLIYYCLGIGCNKIKDKIVAKGLSKIAKAPIKLIFIGIKADTLIGINYAT